MAMSIETKVRLLSTMTTRDEAGRHFAERYNDETIRELEADNLITVDRPIHDATGIPYSCEHWTVEVTRVGVDVVKAFPQFHAE